MIYRIEMTEAQHAWLVEDLIVECITHECLPRDDRGITLDDLCALKDAVKCASSFRPATLEEKAGVLDKIDPDDDDEMDYITAPDENGGRWFLTYHFIDEDE